MGLYFLTPGAVVRQSEIIYDRSGSVFAQCEASLYDWPALLEGADWLHVSGVSPAVGPRAGQAVLEAMRAARALGVRVAFDANYRASLWAARGTDGADVLNELMRQADIAFADQRDMALLLKRPELAERRNSAEALAAAFANFPNLVKIAATSRTQHGIGRHDLVANMHTREGTVGTVATALRGIVDRIGTGDAFAAGVLHGLQCGWDDARTTEFGLAAACYKHGVAGDASPATQAQIEAVRQGAFDVRR
jgi:2-dehydro-3-deoxygluconokinase